MPPVQIVILAKSVKHQNHCVAGKCIIHKKWCRPVSTVTGGELNNEQVMVQNIHGTYRVKPLQKVEMSFLNHVPLLQQPENHLIDGNVWQQKYKINLNEIDQYLDWPDDIWGLGNRVDYSLIESNYIHIQQSLYLVQAQNISLYYDGERKRRASFKYNGIDYDLPVTDPEFYNIVNEDKDFKGILCISLGEEYHGYCYKIVATIF